MRVKLKIFSGGFILILGLLQVQPLFMDFEKQREQLAEFTCVERPICAKLIKPDCSQTKCEAPGEGEDENGDCGARGCNPFVPCSIGFCCYLVENLYSFNHLYWKSIQKARIANDNRIAGSISECWHPPEAPPIVVMV